MSSTAGFEGHDHTVCISDALVAAERTCAEKGLRLTPIRRRVLELLLAEHRAMGAYELLERLGDEGQVRQPPVVYRALSFLTENGFAHKVEKLNAFIACAHPGAAHAPVFLICKSCDTVAEAVAPGPGPLMDAAVGSGFAVETAVIEAEGTCPICQDDKSASAPKC